MLNRFKKTVISDETLVIVQVLSKDAQKALSIIRHVESGHPTSFLLRFDPSANKENVEIVKEPLTADALSQHARDLAVSLKEVGYRKNHHSFLVEKFAPQRKIPK